MLGRTSQRYQDSQYWLGGSCLVTNRFKCLQSNALLAQDFMRQKRLAIAERNRFSREMIKTTTCLLVAAALALAGTLEAGSTKSYQVTGPVLEVTDSMIAVQKGKERWEIARDASTKMTGDVKVGSKVTVMYTMTATEVEAKGEKPKK